MKKYTSIFQAVALSVILYGIFYFMMPHGKDEKEAPLTAFSTQRAMKIVKSMTVKPHYVGSDNHEVVARYVQDELKKLGLETSIQEGFSLSDWGTLTKSKNILARIKGTANTKALMLLSHYDSAPHSFSNGAGDDASGVATVLEGIRTFLHNKSPHKNDIIILFTDAEELGLNGAALFVTEHPWAKEVGLAINFEARGSSGPGYMLMETTKGNAKMIEGFTKAGVKYPAANSLMYSIYKMLPNDTDLTVFREEGSIQGFNFAFIDNHFNYHTEQDSYEHLSPATLAHQGTNLMPLLQYFSNADLHDLTSGEDKVYFNLPFGLWTYSYFWIIPMLIFSTVLFIYTIYTGIKKKLFSIKGITAGFIPFMTAVIGAGLLTYLGWQLLAYMYSAYADILHGFTYNGHAYIGAFITFTIALCFFLYRSKKTGKTEMERTIAPVFVWILINGFIAFKLKGAAFFIIPVIASLLMLGNYIRTGKSNALLNTVLAIPALVILAPFIKMFPVGLGLKLLFTSSVLTVLCFSILLPLFGAFARKNIWIALFLFISAGLFIKAHLASGYKKGEGKPNSLLYVFNKETNKAYWATYDKSMDEWTKLTMGENPSDVTKVNKDPVYSKYGSSFTYQQEAPLKQLAVPSIEFLHDTITGDMRLIRIRIIPNRRVNRYDIFANEKMDIYDLRANGAKPLGQKTNKLTPGRKKILSYYVVDNIPLELDFAIPKDQVLDMRLWESSFDLLTNPMFNIQPRKDWMIAMPFVLNNAVVIQQEIRQK
jgi:hypothetical protein